MPVLDLTPDALLKTTRAVRKRLDFDAPVPDELVRECVAAALQAPSGSNEITMRFVVVRDAAMRKAIGEVYARCWDIYVNLPIAARNLKRDTPELQAQQDRVADSATYLSQHMGEAPVLVIGCTASGRVDNQPAVSTVSMLANIMPAMWNFMLAARARGLGTSWTTIHLMMEQQVAEITGIPFDSVQQACLTPLAFTKGTDFRPALRPEPDRVIHWDTWSS
jgi:nitroreductase